MSDTKKQIVLSGADVFCPQKAGEAYHVEQGEVLVYIVPMENEKTGRRVLLCEVPAGRLIPAFVYRDREEKQWRFAFATKNQHAVLLPVENGVTKVLCRNFLRRAGLSAYEQEGFEGSLVEFYTRETLKDRVFIMKGKRSGAAAAEQACNEIKAVFQKEEPPEPRKAARYQALLFVCAGLGIRLPEEKTLLAGCGKTPDIPELARAGGLICRRVVLEEDWYGSDCGGLVCSIGGETVGCVPGLNGKYRIFYPSNGKTEILTGKTAGNISPQAYSIGRPLPSGSLSGWNILRFCMKDLHVRDLIPAAVLGLVCGGIGCVLPWLACAAFDTWIPQNSPVVLGQLCGLMLSFLIARGLLSAAGSLLVFRGAARVGSSLQNAACHRLFLLPESFFRSFDSSVLGSRVMKIGGAAAGVVDGCVGSILALLLSGMYWGVLHSYCAGMAWICAGLYLTYGMFRVREVIRDREAEAGIARAEDEASSRLYQYLRGIEKIRMAGAEEQALLAYIRSGARAESGKIGLSQRRLSRNLKEGLLGSAAAMALYVGAVRTGAEMSLGSFAAFCTALGLFSGAMSSLGEKGSVLYRCLRTFAQVWPILAAAPEDDENKELPGRLSGGISLKNVTFSYGQDGKKILDDLSLDIRPGEYIGIVGPSGCGKSTLLKLLLGFEQPDAGMVSVDGKDLRTIDKRAYRRQLGIVLQNGKLISGSIYENITVTAPHAAKERVDAVIDQLGLREDISQMPMGIHTMLSENCSTISGGQQQKILLARAIVGAPKILLLDEATSALDNLTQAQVSRSLDEMKITRVVAAHRLSTIKNCSRILVLQGGRIAEEGTYEALMNRKGVFYELVSRQLNQ